MNIIDFCLLCGAYILVERRRCHYHTDNTFKTLSPKIKKKIHECTQNIWNYKVGVANSPFLFSYFALVTGTMETFVCAILVTNGHWKGLAYTLGPILFPWT